MDRLGREGMLDDTKPTKHEDTTKSLMNNDTKNHKEHYEAINQRHYGFNFKGKSNE